MFLAGIFILPAGVTNNPARLQETPILDDVTLEQDAKLSWLSTDRTVRVAVYSETNHTDPAYTTQPGVAHNNATGIRDILLLYGYDVDILIASDIDNLELTTVNYDVFVMVDNFPREYIADRILEFWLGGGGILAFDGSAGFLCYFGILPPESTGSDGYTTYWDFASQDFIVETRHPVSKGYQDQQTITMGTQNSLVWDWSALQGTAIADDLTMIASSSSNANDVAVLAYDPSTGRGGKVVTIAADNDGAIFPELNQMIADAVEWVTPISRGKVLYDLAHEDYHGFDTWDAEYVQSGILQSIQRQDMVSQGYTVDKLFPSASGNLTAVNLEPYDVLIVNAPELNFTAQEVTDVTSWISNGGSLLVIGESLTPEYQNLNYLLTNTHMQLNATGGLYSLYPVGMHVIHEKANTVTAVFGSCIEVASPAIPIYDNGAGRVCIAVEEFGLGRIAVADDTALFRDNGIITDDNRDMATNLMNWLTAGDVLIYAGQSGVGNPNAGNAYRGPLATALNDLGVPFLLTTSLVYFNVSLVTESWKMIAFDMPAGSIDSPAFYDDILDYLKSGGKAVLSTYQMDTDSYPVNTPLLDYVGVSYAGNRFTTPPTIYIWDSAHSIFNTPSVYGADNLTTTLDYVDHDCANLTLHNNATAIAGLGISQSTTNVSIALSDNGNVITNGMLVTAYDDDTDDSTYSDAVELWRGEIAYLMRITIDSPADKVIEHGSVGESIVWAPSSDRPYRYIIERDSVEIANAIWNGGTISVLLDGYAIGNYTFEVTVWDTAGYFTTDTVSITVENVSTTDTTTDTGTTTGTLPPWDTTVIIIIIIIVIIVIIIILIIMKKKK